MSERAKVAEWNPTNEDIGLFNKAVITNTTLTPSERAKLDIIRMKFKHCSGKITKTAEWSEEIELEQIIKQLNEALYLGSKRSVAAVIEEGKTTNIVAGWVITDEDGIAITKTYGTLKELFEHQNPPSEMFHVEPYDSAPYHEEEASFSELEGKTISATTGLTSGSDEVLFYCTDGTVYKMYHAQDCCEIVSIDDVCGDVNNLVGEKIVLAEENSSTKGAPKDEFDDSFTWTFYKLATRKGYVDIRWYGTSNDYYSEKVDFVKIKK